MMFLPKFWYSGLIFIFLCMGSVSCKESTVDPEEEIDHAELAPFALAIPEQDKKEVSLSPLFKWNEAGDTVTYVLSVALDKEFEQVAVKKAGITDTLYQLTTSLEKSRYYYWKVVGFNNNGDSLAVGEIFQFRTEMGEPGPSPGVVKYFVSPDGKDEPTAGTEASPFKTLGYASRMVPAGEDDTLFLKPGTYYEKEPALIKPRVNLVGAGEAEVLIKSDGVEVASGINIGSAKYKLWYDGSLIQLVSPHYSIFRNNGSTVLPPTDGNQEISGFTIDGMGKKLKAGVWVENRDNVTMHHVTFKDLDQRGAVFGPGDKDWYQEPKFYMKGIKIQDCTFLNSGKDLPDETLGNLCLAQLDGAIIEDIKIQDNEGYGIKFIYDGYFKNTKIKNCQISLNESDAKWGEDIAIELWNLGPGNEVYNIDANTWLSMVNHEEVFGEAGDKKNLTIHDVKIIDLDGVSSKEGIEVGMPHIEIYNTYIENKGFAIGVWDMGREDIIIRNNVFYNTKYMNNWASAPAVYIDNSRAWDFKNIYVENNAIVGQTNGVRVKGQKISNIYIRNNIFVDTQTWDVDAVGSSIMVTNNLKYNSSGTSEWKIQGATQDMDNVLGNPLFAAQGERWAGYYHLTDASPAIDQGVDVGLPFQGAAPDLGAYELK